MPTGDFHNRPFDEGTLTKLQVFELYAREWLPVFLSPERPLHKELHLFDFFAGPGADSAGVPGSPLRILRQLHEYRSLSGWRSVSVHVHFFDESEAKIQRLKESIVANSLNLPNVTFDIRRLSFDQSFMECANVLASPNTAKLVFIDQCGVDEVTPDVFRSLVNSPTCDFLFFLSSSTLHRFRDHPAIKQKIVRPDDYYHVHRAALDYYRGLLPAEQRYFLAPFSIKKGSNIYGLIFGSAHPRGMDKFLQVAWQSDRISGEADFDIGRDNIRKDELVLALDEMRPSKIAGFEAELEHLLRNGHLTDELEVMHV